MTAFFKITNIFIYFLRKRVIQSDSGLVNRIHFSTSRTFGPDATFSKTKDASIDDEIVTCSDTEISL